MALHRGCFAESCDRLWRQGRDTGSSRHRLFRFPTNPLRRAIWALKCGRTEEPTIYQHLCQLHFDDSQYESRTESKWKLKVDATPTIFFHQSAAMEFSVWTTVYMEEDSIVQSENLNSADECDSNNGCQSSQVKRHSEVRVKRLPPEMLLADSIGLRSHGEGLSSENVQPSVDPVPSVRRSRRSTLGCGSTKLEEDFDTSKVKRVRLHVNRATPQTPVIVQLVDKTDHSQTPRYPYYQYLRFQIWNNKEPTKKSTEDAVKIPHILVTRNAGINASAKMKTRHSSTNQPRILVCDLTEPEEDNPAETPSAAVRIPSMSSPNASPAAIAGGKSRNVTHPTVSTSSALKFTSSHYGLGPKPRRDTDKSIEVKLKEAEVILKEYRREQKKDAIRIAKAEAKCSRLYSALSKIMGSEYVEESLRQGPPTSKWTMELLQRSAVIWFAYGTAGLRMVRDIFNLKLPDEKFLLEFIKEQRAGSPFLETAYNILEKYEVPSLVARGSQGYVQKATDAAAATADDDPSECGDEWDELTDLDEQQVFSEEQALGEQQLLGDDDSMQTEDWEAASFLKAMVGVPKSLLSVKLLPLPITRYKSVSNSSVEAKSNLLRSEFGVEKVLKRKLGYADDGKRKFKLVHEPVRSKKAQARKSESGPYCTKKSKEKTVGKSCAPETIKTKTAAQYRKRVTYSMEDIVSKLSPHGSASHQAAADQATSAEVAINTSAVDQTLAASSASKPKPKVSFNLTTPQPAKCSKYVIVSPSNPEDVPKAAPNQAVITTSGQATSPGSRTTGILDQTTTPSPAGCDDSIFMVTPSQTVVVTPCWMDSTVPSSLTATQAATPGSGQGYNDIQPTTESQNVHLLGAEVSQAGSELITHTNDNLVQAIDTYHAGFEDLCIMANVVEQEVIIDGTSQSEKHPSSVLQPR